MQTRAHFVHILFVPRHALETDFSATARHEEFCDKKAVLPCRFGHSLDVGFPYFKELPEQES